MAGKQIKKIQGQVLEALPNAEFRVDVGLGEGKTMRCYLTGKMKLNKIKVMVGDRVDVEIPSAAQHLENYIGRIIFRHLK